MTVSDDPLTALIFEFVPRRTRRCVWVAIYGSMFDNVGGVAMPRLFAANELEIGGAI